MSIDLSPWRSAPELVDAIWEVRRGGLIDRRTDVLGLLDHEDPSVREEALSLLFVKWGDVSHRDRLLELLRSDPDSGVRARAAGALPSVSASSSLRADSYALRDIVLDRAEDEVVRKAAYEAVCRIVRGEQLALPDDVDLDEDIALDWLRDL